MGTDLAICQITGMPGCLAGWERALEGKVPEATRRT